MIEVGDIVERKVPFAGTGRRAPALMHNRNYGIGIVVEKRLANDRMMIDIFYPKTQTIVALREQIVEVINEYVQ